MKLYAYLIVAITLISSSYILGYTIGNNKAVVLQLEANNKQLSSMLSKLNKDNQAISLQNDSLHKQLTTREENVKKLQHKITIIDNIVLSDNFVQLYNSAISKTGTANSESSDAGKTRRFDTAKLIENVVINATKYYQCQSKVEAWQHYYKLINS